ncbi:MAG: ABC transporter ATP-binding protein [bacterium]
MESGGIHIRGLKRVYLRGHQEVRALDGIDLDIGSGEFLGVVGSSGSGKSTLLNLLAGLDTPTEGSIEVDGRMLSTMSRHELAQYRAHRVGIVFQTFNLISHRTALQNVELGLYFTDVPRSQRSHRAIAILERLGLGNRLDHRPADLSGGEQQRVALARALVTEPDLLFADEPTGNLDQENTVEIAGLLRHLHAEGLTVVLVTHDRELAGSLTQRTIRLHYGRLSAEGETP